MRSLKVLVLLLIVLGACSTLLAQSKPSKSRSQYPLSGSFETGRYRNTFFGFTIDIPSNWSVPPKSDVAAARTVGLDALKTDKAEHDTRLQKANRTDMSLFTATELLFGVPQPVLITFAAQKQANPKIKAEEVMDATKTLLLASPRIKLLKDVSYSDLGGKRLPMIELSINLGPQADIKQRLYVIMIKGYAVSIGVAFTGDESASRVEKVLGTLKFNRK